MSTKRKDNNYRIEQFNTWLGHCEKCGWFRTFTDELTAFQKMEEHRKRHLN